MEVQEGFSNKNDIERLTLRLEHYLPCKDFGNFMLEYNEQKQSMINTNDLAILQHDIEVLKKNVKSFVTKQDYFERSSVIQNEMMKGFKNRPTWGEFNRVEKRIEENKKDVVTQFELTKK